MIIFSFIGGAAAFAMGYLACALILFRHIEKAKDAIRIRDESIERQKRIENIVLSLWSRSYAEGMSTDEGDISISYNLWSSARPVTDLSTLRGESPIEEDGE